MDHEANGKSDFLGLLTDYGSRTNPMETIMRIVWSNGKNRIGNGMMSHVTVDKERKLYVKDVSSKAFLCFIGGEYLTDHH